MGRFSYDVPPLLCRIFPCSESPIPEYKNELNKKPHNFSNFRSIIPRSLSGNLNPRLNTSTHKICFISNNETIITNRPTLKSYLSVPYNPMVYFFNRYGSSFNQFPQLCRNENCLGKINLQFNVIHLQSVLALAKKLLTKETLCFLDEEAQQVTFLHY